MLSTHNRHIIKKAAAGNSHAVLLHGSYGVGLRLSTDFLIREKNIAPTNRLEISGESGKDLSIDQVRKLYELTRAVRNEELAVIIHDVHTMSDAAQNAFLKLLEEPPQAVYFILTSHSKEKLLPTMLSRVTTVEIKPLDDGQAEKYAYSMSDDVAKTKQILFMAGGKVDEMKKLFEDDEYFSAQLELMATAKRFLTSKPYERLIVLNGIKNRDQAISFVRSIMQLLIHITTRESEKSANAINTLVASTLDQLETNANYKLRLTQLALKL